MDVYGHVAGTPVLVNFWQFFGLTLLDTCLGMFCNFQAGNLLFVLFKQTLFESFLKMLKFFLKILRYLSLDVDNYLHQVLTCKYLPPSVKTMRRISTLSTDSTSVGRLVFHNHETNDHLRFLVRRIPR